MSGFHDVLLPLNLAVGVVGGPERRTEIVSLASGREVRNAVWAGSRRRWDIGGAIGALSDVQALMAFFEARMGRLYGFRFRDPFDNTSAIGGAEIDPQDQVLGVGDDLRGVFQLVKDYGGTVREIVKPVTGSVRVALDGVEQVSGWSLNGLGQVSFDAPPEEDVIVTAGFAFDCAVRFENDQLKGLIETFSTGRAIKVELVELISVVGD